MRILGLVVEYNPFHNGHILHINKSKEIVKPDLTIAVMSSSFVQRGEPAVIDKWKRSQIALEYGIDIVIELPFVYSCQSADYFSKGAIQLLNAIGVTDICFGSESGDIEVFKEIATAIGKNENEYNQLVKKSMKQGLRYPNACNYALKTILGKEIKTPNDLLGLSYVKEIIINNYSITPHCFARTNDYHSYDLQNIASASAIRQAIKNNQDFSHTLPHDDYYKQIYTLNDFYPYLKYNILTSSLQELKSYHMVDEGLEHSLIKIKDTNSIDEFIELLLSKRYTRPRIQRMLIHILMKNSKEEIKKSMNIDYLRILLMNDAGRKYLNSIKKDIQFKIITNYSKYKHPALELELKATKLLSLISQEDLIDKEFSSIPYKNSEI